MKTLQALGLAGALACAPLSSQAETLLGVSDGNQGWELDDVVQLEQWQGEKHAVINLFTGFSETARWLLFDYQLPNIWQHGSVPLITWEPQFTEDTPSDIETKIADGEYDQYIEGWATKLKTFLSGVDGKYGTEDDRRVYLNFAHEMNGNWYPWSATKGENTPADYVRMRQHVHNIFAQAGIDQSRLQWIWTASASDAGDFTAEEYYPGDDYVDWVGIDGYNFGHAFAWSAWRSPEQVFEPMRQRLLKVAPGKPLAIPEVASTSMNAYGTDSSAKNDWIAQLSDYLKIADVRMLSWFNLDKESDWKAYGGTNGADVANGTNVYPAYKAVAQDTAMVSANSANPRIISDSQFKGDFIADENAVTFQKSCQVDYNITSSWGTGYVAKVDTSANFMVPQDWTLDWDFSGDEKVSYAWNGELTQYENQVTVSPPSWWKWKPLGTAPSIGFVGTGTPVAPSSVILDGVSCEVNFSI